jgi:hypothetical protein
VSAVLTSDGAAKAGVVSVTIAAVVIGAALQGSNVPHDVPGRFVGY